MIFYSIELNHLYFAKNHLMHIVFILFFNQSWFQLQIVHLDSRLSLVEKNIKEKTSLLLTSDNSKELSPQVAKLGSNYQDLSTSVKSLKDTINSLQSYQTTLKANITSISVRNNKLFNVLFMLMIPNYLLVFQ